MSQITQIECPSCGSSIDVQDVLSHQVEEKLKREFKEKLEKENVNSSPLFKLERSPVEFSTVLLKFEILKEVIRLTSLLFTEISPSSGI
jgi:hypothetical protein